MVLIAFILNLCHPESDHFKDIAGYTNNFNRSEEVHCQQTYWYVMLLHTVTGTASYGSKGDAQSLFLCSFSKISRFISLHNISPNESKNTNHKHNSLTETDHCRSKIFKNIEFEKDNHLLFRYFRTYARKESSKGGILEGLRV